jgi:hypothetical protein
MRRIIACSIAVFAFLAVVQAATAGSVENALEAYVDGLRSGDVKTLNKLFFNDGQFCASRAAGIKCSSFAETLPSWVEQPDPTARGKILSKEAIGESMARVTYELKFNDDSYVDYLLLYKKDGQWIVVAKTTFLQP